MLPAHDTPAFRELLHQQVEKRRTFAIISHPDAGKTTLTASASTFWTHRAIRTSLRTPTACWLRRTQPSC